MRGVSEIHGSTSGGHAEIGLLRVGTPKSCISFSRRRGCAAAVHRRQATAKVPAAENGLPRRHGLVTFSLFSEQACGRALMRRLRRSRHLRQPARGCRRRARRRRKPPPPLPPGIFGAVAAGGAHACAVTAISSEVRADAEGQSTPPSGVDRGARARLLPLVRAARRRPQGRLLGAQHAGPVDAADGRALVARGMPCPSASPSPRSPPPARARAASFDGAGAQCWGDLGARAVTGVYARAPPSNVVWESLSVGGGHSSGLQRLTDVDFTAVRCFGDNDAGQLNAPAGVAAGGASAGRGGRQR